MEDKIKNPAEKTDSGKSKIFHIENWHVTAFFLLIYDLAAAVGAYFLALWLRFDCLFSKIPKKTNYGLQRNAICSLSYARHHAYTTVSYL
jgi:hypothetical protein